MAIRIKNLGRLEAKLKKLDPITREALGVGVYKAALKVEGDAKVITPVDTGELRQSIATKGKSTIDGAEASVGTNKEYAPYVEFGTSRQQAQPYLKPALQKNKQTAKKIVISELRKAYKGI